MSDLTVGPHFGSSRMKLADPAFDPVSRQTGPGSTARHHSSWRMPPRYSEPPREHSDLSPASAVCTFSGSNGRMGRTGRDTSQVKAPLLNPSQCPRQTSPTGGQLAFRKRPLERPPLKSRSDRSAREAAADPNPLKENARVQTSPLPSVGCPRRGSAGCARPAEPARRVRAK